MKPSPRPHLYEWSELVAWLEKACPSAAREIDAHMERGEPANGRAIPCSFVRFTSETREFLTRELGTHRIYIIDNW